MIVVLKRNILWKIIRTRLLCLKAEGRYVLIIVGHHCGTTRRLLEIDVSRSWWWVTQKFTRPQRVGNSKKQGASTTLAYRWKIMWCRYLLVGQTRTYRTYILNKNFLYSIMTNTFFTSSARWERSDLHLNICIFFSAHLSNLLASFCQRAVQLTCYIFQWTNVQHMNSYVHNPYIFVQQIINFISKQGWAAVGASAAHFALVTTKYQLKCLEREVYIPHCRFRVQPTTVYFSTASGLIHKMSKVLERRVSMDFKMSTCLVKGQNGGSKSTGGWLARLTYYIYTS